MGLNMFVFQLKNGDLSQLSHLGEVSESVANDGCLAKYTENIKPLQVPVESRLHDFGKEEDYILAFMNRFSLGEQKIMKMPSKTQMELIDLKTNSLLKMNI